MIENKCYVPPLLFRWCSVELRLTYERRTRMLKKFVALFLTGLLLCTVTAYAETVDFASMTMDELVDLITQARVELTKRIGVIDNATFGRGTYIEGITIAAGTYRFTCLETDTWSSGDESNYFHIIDSKESVRFSEVGIPINGVVTFTIIEGDELRISGCSGVITRIENPVWLPDSTSTKD